MNLHAWVVVSRSSDGVKLRLLFSVAGFSSLRHIVFRLEAGIQTVGRTAGGLL